MDIKRVNNDSNGNPRWVVHFLNILNNDEIEQLEGVQSAYGRAVAKARPFGGSIYRGKDFGGGVVFQHFGNEQQFKEFVSTINGKEVLA